jgi:arylformamidase
MIEDFHACFLHLIHAVLNDNVVGVADTPVLALLHFTCTMPLSKADNPDDQMPMPFEAADRYAQWVMAQARQADFSGLIVQCDLAYGSHPLQRCDVFAPSDVNKPPVLIFWHGGGWTNGYRQYVHFMAQQVCAMGIALVAPSYRLAPAHKLPSAYEDALLCLKFVQVTAETWGADAQRIVLSGHSAGGHLAALVALRGMREQPQAIRACLPISAIMDLHHPVPTPGSLEERVYTMLLDDPSHDALMSPICWAAGNSIPFALIVGEHDSERVRLGNQRLQALLSLQKAPCSLHRQAGQSHFDTHTSLQNQLHPWFALLHQYAFGQIAAVPL